MNIYSYSKAPGQTFHFPFAWPDAYLKGHLLTKMQFVEEDQLISSILLVLF